MGWVPMFGKSSFRSQNEWIIHTFCERKLMNQRITVRYEGRVQGVGFRFTVVRLAQDLNVTGWVKNEFDGSVSMTAEGEEDQLMALLKAIRNSQLDRYITNELVRRSPGSGEFETFGVLYW